MSNHHVDVLIIGAGLSGIGAACHLTRNCPSKSYAIIERRQAMGGTWDLFRYPGIRSDSDMFTLGYSFKPWTEPRVLADGPSIKKYIEEAAEEYNVNRNIHFGLKALDASWDTDTATWTVTTLNEETGKKKTFTANFVIGCTGYYNYDEGFTPDFPGLENFKGQVIHPQHWPENLNYEDKKVVVIGSGATAITLVPSMADKAAHVTMLQRSPTYIASIPSVDPMLLTMRKVMPEKLVYSLGRARNVGLQRMIYKICRQRPDTMKRLLLTAIKRRMGAGFDMKHFTPKYNPWDQRLCVVPDSDLFKAIKNGQASIATDTIDTFVDKGIKLSSGEVLEADIVITATGLKLQMLGGMTIHIDGKKTEAYDTMSYKGIMLQGLPNMGMVFGYTNSSWTLKADLANEYYCRLINYMDQNGWKQCTPRDHEGVMTEKDFLGLESGYVKRVAHELPKQGSKDPWNVVNNYFVDLPRLRFSKVDDGFMEFSQPKEKVKKGLVSRITGPIRAVMG